MRTSTRTRRSASRRTRGRRRYASDSRAGAGFSNQQIHGSTRSLRSVEDFSQFEQRTAYFDGDHVSAARKTANLLLRELSTGQNDKLLAYAPRPCRRC
jgi:cytochrome c peroxidase